MDEIRLHDIVQMRKQHPCGSDQWRVIRIGADIKIKCTGCNRIVMLDRSVFLKRRKKVLQQGLVPEAETLKQMKEDIGDGQTKTGKEKVFRNDTRREEKDDH